MRITYIDPFRPESAPFIASLISKLEYNQQHLEVKPFKTAWISYNGYPIPIQLTTPLKPFFTMIPLFDWQGVLWGMSSETSWHAVDEQLDAGVFGSVSAVRGTYKLTSNGLDKRYFPIPFSVLKEGNHEPSFTQPYFVNEQIASMQTPHLKARISGDRYFTPLKPSLLMKKKPGITLYDLRCKLWHGHLFLSVDQLLELAIAMVDAFNQQVVLPGLCHNDIKDDNILIDLGPPIQVNFIDYGLATRQDKNVICQDKPSVFTDPRLIPDNHQIPKSIDTDLYSLGVVLALLLGDTSIDVRAKEKEKLLRMASEYSSANLWSRAGFIDKKSKKDSQNLLRQMLAIDVKDRLSVEAVRQSLIKIKSQHLEAASEKLNKLTNETPFDALTQNDLLLILSSNSGSSFLEKYGLEAVIDKLEMKILLLPTFVLQRDKIVFGKDLSLFPESKAESISAVPYDMLRNYVKFGGQFKQAHFLWLLQHHPSAYKKLDWLKVLMLVYQHLDETPRADFSEIIPNNFILKTYRFFIQQEKFHYHPKTICRIIENHNNFENRIDKQIKQFLGYLNYINEGQVEEMPLATVLLDRFKAYKLYIARQWTVEENTEVEQINALLSYILECQNSTGVMQLKNLFKRGKVESFMEILHQLQWIAEDATITRTSKYL